MDIQFPVWCPCFVRFFSLLTPSASLITLTHWRLWTHHTVELQFILSVKRMKASRRPEKAWYTLNWVTSSQINSFIYSKKIFFTGIQVIFPSGSPLLCTPRLVLPGERVTGRSSRSVTRSPSEERKCVPHQNAHAFVCVLLLLGVAHSFSASTNSFSAFHTFILYIFGVFWPKQFTHISLWPEGIMTTFEKTT